MSAKADIYIVPLTIGQYLLVQDALHHYQCVLEKQDKTSEANEAHELEQTLWTLQKQEITLEDTAA